MSIWKNPHRLNNGRYALTTVEPSFLDGSSLFLQVPSLDEFEFQPDPLTC